MRTMLSIVVLIALASLAKPHAAGAGECFGMLHYTYDAGECTDTGGDTTQVMIDSSNDSEALNEGIAERSRSSYVGRGAKGVDEKVFNSVYKGLYVTYSGPLLMPSRMARAFAGKNAKARARLETIFADQIYAYDHQPKNFPLPMLLINTRILFLENAYRAFDGEILSDDGTRELLHKELGSAMMPAKINALTMKQKESIREAYVLTAFLLSNLDTYYAKHRDASRLRDLRAFARKQIVADLQIDPAKVRLAQLPCNMYGSGNLVPCAAVKRTLRYGY